MVKHTQTIRRLFADKLFECVWPFCEIGALKVNSHLNMPQTESLHLQEHFQLYNFTIKSAKWRAKRIYVP